MSRFREWFADQAGEALRRNLVMLFFGLVATLLAWRAVYLQTSDHERLQNFGRQVSVRQITVEAHRGQITDRDGEPLAISTPVFSLGANPSQLLQSADGVERVAEILELDADDLRDRLEARRDRQFYWVRRHLPPAVSERLRASEIDGLELRKEYKRYYPTSEVAAHLVGFTNVDDQGQEGVELAYDQSLAGHAGTSRVLRDNHGQVIESLGQIKAARPGTDLRLTIDRRLQYVVYRELEAAVARHQAASGSVVVVDARNGEVLALANQPSFNPNSRSDLRGEFYRNRALTDVFEPGSTLKPFTVAAALASGRYQPDTPLDTSPGYYSIGQHVVRDIRNYGQITVADVLRHSSNVGSSRLALSIDSERLWETFRGFGFGDGTGSGLPGEGVGRLAHYSDWSEIEQATLAFGYGLSVTALQLARAYTVLANDGVRIDLTVQAADPSRSTTNVLPPDVARRVREMLVRVVEEGTGKRARIPGYSVAGKTGTVHKVSREGYAEDRYRSLFAGMVPATRPQLVAVVVIEDPRDGAYFGGDVAAPVFASVMREATRLMNLPPDRPQELEIPVAAVSSQKLSKTLSENLFAAKLQEKQRENSPENPSETNAEIPAEILSATFAAPAIGEGA